MVARVLHALSTVDSTNSYHNNTYSFVDTCIKGLVRFAYGASIFAYISNMKIESYHAEYGLTIALSTIRPGGGPYSILLADEDMDL